MKILNSNHEVAEALRVSGGVGVIATDTVYGLVARAADRKAVKRLYALKRRENKPGTVIAASVAALVALGLPARALGRMARLWPNPVSVVVPAGERLVYLHQGLDSLAVRVPADDALRGLLEQTGPLLTSSANQPGEPGSTKLAEAHAYFGDKVDFYLDGGDLAGRAPSTIVRFAGGKLEVLRQGALEIDPGGVHFITASKSGCPFCRANGLLKGPVLGASDGAYMIEAVSNPGHFLIIPDTHVESLSELTDTWWSEVKELLLRVPNLNDFNLSVNMGRDAGQTVKHVHIWVIPRAAGESASGKGLMRLIDEANERGR